MNMNDIFKNSFLRNFNSADINTSDIIMILAFTAVLAIYIFLIYQIFTRKSFYNKEFNISIVAMALITVSIILSIQSSIVVSLGMVGALSIVRFRTAVKNPLDLIFLFWSLAIGIICGVRLFEIAIISSLVITFFLFVLDVIPVSKVPIILVIQSQKRDLEKEIERCISECAKYYKVKSRNINKGQLNLVIEVKPNDPDKLLQTVYDIEGIEYVSVIDHNGETAF